MAIIDDEQELETSSGFRNTGKAIDINDTSLEDGEEQAINKEADAWDQPAPPPDGDYKVKAYPAKVCFKQDKTEDGVLFYTADLELKIQDNEKWAKQTIFYKVNTLIGNGKEISPMASLIVKAGLGEKLPSRVTPKQVAQLFAKILKQEPNYYISGEWKAGWDDKKRAYAKVGMKNFPKNEQGGYSHIITLANGERKAAAFKINKVIGVKQYKQEMERKKQVDASRGGKKDEKPKENFKPLEKAQVSRGDEEFVLDE